MTELQAVCGVISTMCTLIWIVNQIFWYKMFKNYFDRQEALIDYQLDLTELHTQLLNAQLREYNPKIPYHKTTEMKDEF